VGAGELADVLRGIRATWEAATGDDQACGLPAAASGYARMRQAWLAELGAHVATLERLGGTDGR